MKRTIDCASGRTTMNEKIASRTVGSSARAAAGVNGPPLAAATGAASASRIDPMT